MVDVGLFCVTSSNKVATREHAECDAAKMLAPVDMILSHPQCWV